MQLYVIRHGQKTIESRPADAPDWKLTDLGHRQAERVAETFRNIHLDMLVSSPLHRTLQTAPPLARMAGLKLHVWSDLVENYNGSRYIGPTPVSLRQTYPIKTIEPEEPDGWIYAGGETMEEAKCRVEKVLNRLDVKRNPRQTVALIAHRAFNQYLFNRIFGCSLTLFEQLNGCINHLVFREDGVLVNGINDTRHIPVHELTEN